MRDLQASEVAKFVPLNGRQHISPSNKRVDCVELGLVLDMDVGAIIPIGQVGKKNLSVLVIQKIRGAKVFKCLRLIPMEKQRAIGFGQSMIEPLRRASRA